MMMMTMENNNKKQRRYCLNETEKQSLFQRERLRPATAVEDEIEEETMATFAASRTASSRGQEMKTRERNTEKASRSSRGQQQVIRLFALRCCVGPMPPLPPMLLLSPKRKEAQPTNENQKMIHCFPSELKALLSLY